MIPNNDRTWGLEKLSATVREGTAEVRISNLWRGADLAIEPDDVVVALFISGNRLETSPPGRSTRKCSAYVCGFRRGGRYLVCNIWLETLTGSVIVCVPSVQPEDETAFRRTVDAGVFYFETIGFIMEEAAFAGEENPLLLLPAQSCHPDNTGSVSRSA